MTKIITGKSTFSQNCLHRQWIKTVHVFIYWRDLHYLCIGFFRYPLHNKMCISNSIIYIQNSPRSSKTKHKTCLQKIVIEWWCSEHGRNRINSKSKTPQHTTVHTFICILNKCSQHGVTIWWLTAQCICKCLLCSPKYM